MMAQAGDQATCGNPLTTIQADGTWSADITRRCRFKRDAVAAFVVPASSVSRGVTTILAFRCGPAASRRQRNATRVILRRARSLVGYDWWVKASASPVGPGPN